MKGIVCVFEKSFHQFDYPLIYWIHKNNWERKILLEEGITVNISLKRAIPSSVPLTTHSHTCQTSWQMSYLI